MCLMQPCMSLTQSLIIMFPSHSVTHSPTCPPCRESWRRAHLWSLVDRLGALLDVPALSPVVPLVLGGEREVLEASARLLEGGKHVPAIRPPTVPAGTCR